MKLNTVKSIASEKLARGHYDLASFSHTGFDETFYIVNNNEPIIYDGNEYFPFNFGVVLTSKKEVSGASIVFSNVDKRIEEQLEKALKYPNEYIVCRHTQVTIERNTTTGELVVGRVANDRLFELITPVVTKETVQSGMTLRTSFTFNIGRKTYNSNDFVNINL